MYLIINQINTHLLFLFRFFGSHKVDQIEKKYSILRKKLLLFVPYGDRDFI